MPHIATSFLTGSRAGPHLPPTPSLRAQILPFAPAWRACVVVGLSAVAATSLAAQGKRPMTFLDVQNMRQVGTPDLSTDGRWLLYTLSVPDWKEARRQTDIYRRQSPSAACASTRQLTYTKDKNETAPALVPRRELLRLRLGSRRVGARDCGRADGRAPRQVAAPYFRRAAPSPRRAAAAVQARSSTSCVRMAAKRARSPTRGRACRRSPSRKTASGSSIARAARTKSSSTLCPVAAIAAGDSARPVAAHPSSDGRRALAAVAGLASASTS